MRLYTHPKLRISVEELHGLPYIREVWRGVFNPLVFRDLIENSLKIYEKELPGIKKNQQDSFLLFADTRDLEMIRMEEINWLNEVINPQYEQLGFTHQAVLAPLSQFASKKVEEVNSDENYLPFKTKVFIQEKEATQWFLNQ